ncbi:MAG TPA: serine hydrolase domain-containing protein [Thermoanaerobaculia bacterium]
MRRLLLLVLIALAALPASARRRAASASDPLVITSADAIATAALAEGIPGLTIAVRKGTAVFIRSYGIAGVDSGTEARADTVYQIASVTKQFTAAAIMRLEEDERLALDDRAGLYLPELDERFDAITIRHLLTHGSGLRDYESQLQNPFEEMTQQQIIALITSSGPLFTPGSEYEYSNSGYYLLGIIIERTSGRPYEQFLRETFFEPLGLTQTSYCGTRSPSPAGTILLAGAVIPIPAAHMSIVGAAGALCSTAADLIRWNTALTNGIAVSSAAYDRMIGQGNRMGLGLHYGFGLVVDTRGSVLSIWHNGSILGFQSMLLWIPERELTIAVLTNLTDLDRDRAGEIARALAASIEP